MDVSAEVLDHSFLAKTIDGHLLVHEVRHDITRCTSADIDPDAREEGAGAHDEGAVEQAVEGILEDIMPLTWGTDVVCKTSNGSGVASHVIVLPLSNEANEEVALELSVENLGKEVEVGDEGSLEDDRDVGGVEQFDWVWIALSAGAFALKLKFNSEALFYGETNIG